MKKLLLAILCLTIFNVFASPQGQGLEDIIVEKYYISDANDAANTDGGTLPVGSVTYRIYVDLAPGYVLQSVYGDPDHSHELRIETTTDFFNNTDRGASTANAIGDNYLKNNTIMLDSWISLGAGSAGKIGILKADDTDGAIANADGVLQNDDARAGIPIKTADGLIAGATSTVSNTLNSLISIFEDENSGSVLSTSDGMWFSPAGGVKGTTDDNRVLIAQLTTNGILSFKLNLQIRRESDFKVENWVSSYPIFNDQFIDETFCEKCIYTPEAENIAPLVSITTPTNGTIYTPGEVVNVTANASDEDGTITLVELFVNDVKVSDDATAPYQFEWTAVTGQVNLTAVATDNDGAKDTSSIVTISIPTAISDIHATGHEFRIFPNPVKKVLTFEVVDENQNSRYSYVITNMDGKLLMQYEGVAISGKICETIDISSIPDGAYIFSIKSSEGFSSTKQFIKNQ